MPENISFAEIPVDIRTPGQYIEIDPSRAVQGLPDFERRILVFGQRLTTGTVAAEVPVRVLNEDQAEQFFGRGSMLHAMFVALKAANQWTDTWAVALDDASAGVAATGALAFGGTVTQAGTLHLYIAGTAVRVAVAAAEAANTTAANVQAAIAALPDLPVTAAVNGGDDTQVDITARHKGLCGNDIDIRLNYYTGEALPAGRTVTITAMNGGTTNPDIADALAALGDEQYYTMVMPWTDAANMAALETELVDRWGPMAQNTATAFAHVAGSHSTIATWGAARNSPHVAPAGITDVPQPPWVWAAVRAGVVAYHGGIDPARPFQTLALPGLMAPPEASRYTQSERNLHLHGGIGTFRVEADGTVLIDRVVTSYQTNAYAVESTAFLDLNTVWTVDYIRYAVRARIAERYPRHKLADDGTNFADGQAIVTPRILRAELLALFRELEQVGLVERFDDFKDQLQVVRSQQDPNRVNSIIPPNIVNQFRIFAAAVQFRL